MTDTSPDPEQQTTVDGGGGPPVTADPVAAAVAHLELLSPDAREQVLAKMDPSIAERIRMRLETMPDRPHGDFSRDVAERRRMLREMADRVAARRAQAADRETAELANHAAAAAERAEAASPANPQPNATATARRARPPREQQQPAADPLASLRTLHPAAIARAMQGERAEAWAIVLDRLDVNARAALQLYLDGSARTAIEQARTRQAELAATSPALLGTVEAAIARTVVPRAMREQQQLLSTTPMSWSGT